MIADIIVAVGMCIAMMCAACLMIVMCIDTIKGWRK